jgi:hypothetical protein
LRQTYDLDGAGRMRRLARSARRSSSRRPNLSARPDGGRVDRPDRLDVRSWEDGPCDQIVLPRPDDFDVLLNLGRAAAQATLDIGSVPLAVYLVIVYIVSRPFGSAAQAKST